MTAVRFILLALVIVAFLGCGRIASRAGTGDGSPAEVDDIVDGGAVQLRTLEGLGGI